MTITREQVEAAAQALDRWFAHKPDIAFQVSAVMLRDLWQRVEWAEARIVELEAARPEILR